MEIQLTQEQVDAAIEGIITKQLREMRFDCYDYYGEPDSQSFYEYVRERAKSVVEKYIEKKFAKMVDEEVAEVARMEAMAAFLSKPVKITDGYRSTEYESWDSYLLKQIHDQSLKNWNVDKKIREEIDKRVNQLWKECAEKARTLAIGYFTDCIEKKFGEA